MKVFSSIDLFLAAKPVQYEILDQVMEAFAESSTIVTAYVRGSLASSNFDRVSDVDFAAVYPDDVYGHIGKLLPEIMATKFNLVLPPWRDGIVRDFGGEGFVFLIEYQSKIYSVDIYILPRSAESTFVGRTSAKLIFVNETNDSPKSPVLRNDGLRKGLSNEEDFTEECFIELITLGFLLTKRIHRSQIYLNYSETFLMNAAFTRLVRSVLDPNHVDYGYYHIEERLSSLPIGRKYLQMLAKFIESPLSDMQSVREKILGSVELIRTYRPEVYSRNARGLEFFCDHIWPS